MSETSSPSLPEETQFPEQELQGLVDAAVLHAPHLDWHAVDPRVIRHLKINVKGMPWMDHLALIVLILASHTRVDKSTVRNRVGIFHARWRSLFPAYALVTFADWVPSEHFPRYLSDTKLDDSLRTRQEFLRVYAATAHHVQVYLRSLPTELRSQYQQWALPSLQPGLRQQLYRGDEVVEEQRVRRKIESDALAPHFARIRGEAHLRWNQLQRLRRKFREVVALVEAGQAALPVSFSYEEEGLDQQLHFLLWDRYTFVQRHADQYSAGTVWEARRKIRGFRPERNHFFLEFVGTKMGTNDSCPLDLHKLLWFGDILRYDLLCMGPGTGKQEEIQQKQEYLHSWGYDATEMRMPFSSDVAGLLAWPRADGSANFLVHAQRRAKGVLLLVEPLFAAATFGLAALDCFTTTGARVSELLQVSLSPDCLYSMEVEGTTRLLLRLIPKGTDKLSDYVIGPETRKNFEKVAHLLVEHYQLQLGEALPKVNFTPHSVRVHQFPGKRPYLFQYQHQHLSPNTITACMRFLCHGMVFQTTEGKTVVLKAHLLRHVFATHIHQVEHVPLDVVAVILHQKNVQVTSYYAAPPWQQVLTTANSLLDRFATHLGSIEDAFVRAPAELQQQLEEAKQKVGTLTHVVGGQCTCHAICPISFACTGCVFKVPEPEREDEIIEQENWAFVRLEQVRRRRLGPEIVKMEALVQRCKTEREEMQLIKVYRKDEAYESSLRIKCDE